MNRRTRGFALLFSLLVLLGDGRSFAAGKNSQEITLDLQNADISSFFQIIADVSSLNVVLDSEVTGRVTLRLHDVPWPQVLDSVLKMHRLSRRREGKVLYIFPTEKTKQYFRE